jgi:hypothetical protein
MFALVVGQTVASVVAAAAVGHFGEC